jgi:hypothetical protein
MHGQGNKEPHILNHCIRSVWLHIHVPTVLHIGKAAVYETRKNVPQGKSADKKEESDPLPLALNLQLSYQSFCS